MLEETRRIYENYADTIPNWRLLDKNELCRKYIEYENDPYLSSAYFSAIVLSYWGKIKESKYRQRMDSQCYDILIDSIMKALKNRRWEQPDSTIYNDPNGPDKAINRIFKHLQINEIIKSRAQKYYADTSAQSLESLIEETNGYVSLGEVDQSDEMCLDMDVIDHVTESFMSKDYFMGFLVHIVSYEQCFSTDDTGSFLSVKKVCGILHHMDESWCKNFSEKYSIDLDLVKKAASYFVGMKTDVLTKKIDWYLRDLKYYGTFSRG